MAKKPDWTKIKHEYETTQTSYRKLVQKYGVSLTALKTRAKKEEWVTCKKEIKHRIDTRTTQKAIEKLSDRNTRHLDLTDKVLDACEKMFEQLKKGIDMFGNEFESDIINHTKVSRIMETIERAQKCHRIAEGLMTEFERRKIEIEHKRIELEEKKVSAADNLPDIVFTDFPIPGQEDDDAEL